jgi:hypothetical protein
MVSALAEEPSMTIPSPPPAGLKDPTKRFLNYLQKHPELRAKIRAPAGQTVAYAGDFASEPAFVRLLRLQISAPNSNDFCMLPDVLKRIPAPADLFAAVGLVTPPTVKSMLDYVSFLTGDGDYRGRAQVPWREDGFIIWRALSGIFVSQASGRVRLLVGDAPDPSKKVFFKTEIFVLERNPNIDPFSKTAIQTLRAQMKAGTIPGQIELV